MANTSKEAKLNRRDVAYYRRRQQNAIYSAIAKLFAEEAERGNVTKKMLAEKLDKDPSQITRWLSNPTNLEIDTISDILLAMDAEMDHSVCRFADRATPNYEHPLVKEDLAWSIRSPEPSKEKAIFSFRRQTSATTNPSDKELIVE